MGCERRTHCSPSSKLEKSGIKALDVSLQLLLSIDEGSHQRVWGTLFYSVPWHLRYIRCPHSFRSNQQTKNFPLVSPPFPTSEGVDLFEGRRISSCLVGVLGVWVWLGFPWTISIHFPGPTPTYFQLSKGFSLLLQTKVTECDTILILVKDRPITKGQKRFGTQEDSDCLMNVEDLTLEKIVRSVLSF